MLDTQEQDKEELLARVRDSLSNLNEQLEAEIPEIKSILTRLNSNLRKNKELFLLLTDEEISPLYRAYTRNLEELKPAKKPAKKKKQSLAELGALGGLGAFKDKPESASKLSDLLNKL